MPYAFFLLLPSPLALSTLTWALAVSPQQGSETVEHLILCLLTGACVWILWPSLESAINPWVYLSGIVITLLLWSLSPLTVYILFELSLIPITILILGWGVQPERIAAIIYLLVYTLVFSAPLLTIIISIETLNGSYFSPLLYFLASLAFMVNIPLFLFHTWLPKAHVEAPTSGSILLAGILLNIGGIGLIWIQNYSSSAWSLSLYLTSLAGTTLSSLLCSFQSDINAFVAYSSVAHINYAIVVILIITPTTGTSTSVLIVSHAFTSSILLLLAGTCFHFLSTRILFFLRGTFLLKSTTALIFFAILSTNFSAPTSIAFLGETMSLWIIWSSLWGVLILLLAYLVLAAYYSLLLGLSLSGNNQLRLSPNLLTSSLVGLSLFDLIWISIF